MIAFSEIMCNKTGSKLRGLTHTTLQVNVGNRCNQLCYHCHVKATPESENVMSWKTMESILKVAGEVKPELFDITGGAPELNPFLPRFLKSLSNQEHDVQVRTNLTVLQDSGMDEMMDLYKELQIRLVASLPCYLEEDVDHQRGEGVFKDSIEILWKLNELGYGLESELELDLVFNPEGPFLPPEQSQLEATYKEVLLNEYNIHFNNLLTITNMPIGRFQEWLEAQGNATEYQELLVSAFNASTLDRLMCRHQICVGWDGLLYDCDFNLALGLPVVTTPNRVTHFDAISHRNREIVTGPHCFGCTAGSGSSCSGALE